MRISDIIKMGLMNLWRRKGRTLLTILGVIIGSISVVLMISIALGSEKATMEMMESFGNIRIVEIRGDYADYDKYYQDEENSGVVGGGRRLFTEKDGEEQKKLNSEAIEEVSQLANVELVIPYYEVSFEFVSGKLRTNEQVMVCDLEKLQKTGFELAEGRLPEKGEKAFISYGDMGNNFYDPSSDRWEPQNITVYGETLKSFFNNSRDKKANKKRPLRLEAVGKTKENGEYSWNSLMDIEVFNEIKKNDIRKYGNYSLYRKDKNKDLYTGIKVLVDNTENVVAVSKTLESMGYQARNQMEFLEEMKKQTGIMKLILGGIGAVSLFVAAIGITNTMVMAIYERTREIGVMKVLGAEVFDILKLFLLEAALIGLIGGAVGLGLSYLGSHFINAAVAHSENMPEGMQLSYIPVWLSISSLIFSSLIGVIAGIIPAIRATRLSALEAIKTSN